MRATLALSILVTTTVLVGAAPAAAGTTAVVDAPTAAAFETPTNACRGTSGTVARALLPTGDVYGSGERLTVLPGSNLRIVLCDRGSVVEAQWSPDLPEGFVSTALDDGRVYSVNVTADARGSEVTVRGSTDETGLQDRSGPTLRVSAGATIANGSVTPDSTRVRFASIDDRSEYVDARQEYLALRDEILTNASRLERLTEDLGKSPESLAENDSARRTAESLARIENLSDRRGDATGPLFTAATSGDSNATRVMNEYRTNERETRERVRGALRTYRKELRAEENGATGGILANLVATLVVGTLLGGGGGWLYTRRRLEQVQRARQYSADETYGIRLMGPQLLVGAVLALAAVGLLFVTEVLGGLSQVVVP
jgi:hypothetical protein